MAKKIETVNNGSGVSSNGYNKIESWDAANIEELSTIYYRVLQLLGEDPEREGLKCTPLRVAKALKFMTMGYDQNPCEIINSAKFKEEYKQMVLVKDIDFYSLCEHHMLPFFGRAHVAYIPNGYITGLSKIARVVEAFSRRLQVQERTDNPDKERYPGLPESARGSGSNRGTAYVHADKRSPEAKFGNDHIGIHRNLPRSPSHEGRVCSPYRINFALKNYAYFVELRRFSDNSMRKSSYSAGIHKFDNMKPT